MNLIAIVGAGAVAGVGALLISVLFSERVRKQGLLGAIRQQFSPAARFRSPYRG